MNERLLNELRDDRIQHRIEADKRMEKMEKDASDLDKKSVENFAAWRDYLHKYFTVVLAFIGGSGILASTQSVNDYRLSIGILFALGGILIGFIGINVYFYLERKWFQAQHTMSAGGYFDYHEHPMVKDGDILKAISLHLKDKLKPFYVELESAKESRDYEKIKSVKKIIKARKGEIFILNFVGQQFNLIQTIWIYFVSLSVILTFVGITFIFITVIDFS